MPPKRKKFGKTQRCKDCDEIKPITEFPRYRGKHGSWVYKPRCKPCWTQMPCNQPFVTNSNGYQSEWQKRKRSGRDDTERYEFNRRKTLAKYGWKSDDFDAVYTEQRGCCGICNTHQSELRKTLAIEHNHDTGEVRGLVCDHCNVGMGRLNDDPYLAFQASLWLHTSGNIDPRYDYQATLTANGLVWTSGVIDA